MFYFNAIKSKATIEGKHGRRREMSKDLAGKKHHKIYWVFKI